MPALCRAFAKFTEHYLPPLTSAIQVPPLPGEMLHRWQVAGSSDLSKVTHRSETGPLACSPLSPVCLHGKKVRAREQEKLSNLTVSFQGRPEPTVSVGQVGSRHLILAGRDPPAPCPQLAAPGRQGTRVLTLTSCLGQFKCVLCFMTKR